MTEPKLSKVKQVKYLSPFTNDYGTFYTFKYEMYDGVILTANHKEQKSFQEGDQVEYLVKGDNSQHGKYGKVGKPQNTPQAIQQKEDNTKGIKVGHAINNAVNLITGSGKPIDENILQGEIKRYATMIYKLNEELNAEL